jgi:membrane associated rhomboid family serine protease
MALFTPTLVLVNVAFSILAFYQTQIMARYQFNPYQIRHRNQWYRFLTHAFLHADWMHLIINMLVLWSFGSNTELMLHAAFPEWGGVAYLGLYFGAIIASSISTFRKHQDDHWYNAVGASGAVSAVLFAHVVFAPMATIYLYGIIPLPSVVWALLYVGYSIWSNQNHNDNINHEAHLWGGAYGMLYILLLLPQTAAAFIEQITRSLS